MGMDPIKLAEFAPAAAALAGGRRLRELRERLGLTLRAVEDASNLIAQSYQNIEYSIPPSRLSDIETKGILPSIYRVHSLAMIYRIERDELLSWFGIPAGGGTPVALPTAPNTHLMEKPATRRERIHLPYRLDPAFDERKTVDIGRFIQQWGSVPMRFVESMAGGHYLYGYIGTEDLTMYPIIPPGSFVQIDPTKNKVRKGIWRSDYERPIYFLETREEYLCGWCVVNDGKVIVQPHPMSPSDIRILRLSQEAEVIGQVVGAAIRLGDLLPSPRE